MRPGKEQDALAPGGGPGGTLAVGDVVRALGSLCAFHRLPFDAHLLLHQLPPPLDVPALLTAAATVGLRARAVQSPAERLPTLPLPALVLVAPEPGARSPE